MTGQTNEAQWYIARDGKQHGPLTDVEMRTFVGHSYLRPTDLLWRPGMADWLPAPQVFPAAFQAPQAPAPMAPQAPQQTQAPAARAPQQTYQQPNPAGAPPAGPAQMAPGAPAGARPAHEPDFAQEDYDDEKPRSGMLRRLALAAVVLAVVGAGAYGIVTYKDTLAQLVSGPPKKPAPVEVAGNEPAPVPGAEPVAVPGEMPEPQSVDGSAIDTRLQKIALWEMLKREYPDWYVGNVAAAEKLSAENKPELEVATQLVQGLVNLRRQNAPKALAAGPDKLRNVASAFLENLRALQAQSVGACYGFISKGELSPAVIEMMQQPETATTLNTQLSAIFEAVSEGTKAPVKHESAGKADYDILIAELTKLGWKEEDLQVFSNPRMLSKREPAQVCKMVQDWFSAHLSVQDSAAQERLLYETLKPVVSG